HFVGDFRVYTTEPFIKNNRQRFDRQTDPDKPSPLQSERVSQLASWQKNETDVSLVQHQNFLMSLASLQDHRVFFVGSRRFVEDLRRRFLGLGCFAARTIDQWTDSRSPYQRS